jgi:hypothetical protein
MMSWTMPLLFSKQSTEGYILSGLNCDTAVGEDRMANCMFASITELHSRYPTTFCTTIFVQLGSLLEKLRCHCETDWNSLYDLSGLFARDKATAKRSEESSDQCGFHCYSLSSSHLRIDHLDGLRLLRDDRVNAIQLRLIIGRQRVSNAMQQHLS